MLTFLGLQLGTVFQGGTLLAVIGAVIIWWIRGAPDRQRADNEADQIKINEAELIRTDYAKQIRDFRLEVHGYRNDLQDITFRLSQSEAQSKRRGDKITMMAFVLKLVMAELRRLDPDNQVMGQAESLLGQIMDEGDPSKSDALNTAEHAVADAKQTVRTTTATRDEVRAAEAKP